MKPKWVRIEKRVGVVGEGGGRKVETTIKNTCLNNNKKMKKIQKYKRILHNYKRKELKKIKKLKKEESKKERKRNTLCTNKERSPRNI